jgi:hypothetical protein
MVVLARLPMVVWLFLGGPYLAIHVMQFSFARGEFPRTPSTRSSQKSPSVQVEIYVKRFFCFEQTMVRWRTSSALFARSVPQKRHCPAKR